ncbi:hypothetical protein PROFUN_10051 [Planoprotostelium fungivorum]|uniref:PAS domain-containing protein n=1 Tax=Planoprotostelium fungivorum TaxID=1890364 RepID=A0A2P6NFG2_9EUKA|nr:hypothetical protein PROFUN_10051 [Planoprotostelium fungivorum]
MHLTIGGGFCSTKREKTRTAENEESHHEDLPVLSVLTSRPCGRCIRLNRECLEVYDDMTPTSQAQSPNTHQPQLIQQPHFYQTSNGRTSPPQTTPPQSQSTAIRKEALEMSWFYQESHAANSHSGHTTPPPLPTDDHAANVIQLFISRGWMSEREATMFFKSAAEMYYTRVKHLDPRITEIKLNEQKQLIDNVPISCILYDCWRRPVYANLAFYRLTGLSVPVAEMNSLDMVGIFDYTNASLMAWSVFSSEVSVTVPCFLRTFSPRDVRTLDRHGMKFVEGTALHHREMSPESFPYCLTVYFMPSPQAGVSISKFVATSGGLHVIISLRDDAFFDLGRVINKYKRWKEELALSPLSAPISTETDQPVDTVELPRMFNKIDAAQEDQPSGPMFQLCFDVPYDRAVMGILVSNAREESLPLDFITIPFAATPRTARLPLPCCLSRRMPISQRGLKQILLLVSPAYLISCRLAATSSYVHVQPSPFSSLTTPSYGVHDATTSSSQGGGRTIAGDILKYSLNPTETRSYIEFVMGQGQCPSSFDDNEHAEFPPVRETFIPCPAPRCTKRICSKRSQRRRYYPSLDPRQFRDFRL